MLPTDPAMHASSCLSGPSNAPGALWRCFVGATVVFVHLVLIGCAGNPRYLYPVVDSDEQPAVSRYVVREVIPKSPIARAGLKRGDEILLINDKPIESLFETGKPERLKKTVKLNIRRGGQELEISAQKRRESDFWGFIAAYLDGNGRAVPVYWTVKPPGGATAGVFNHDGTFIGVQMVRGNGNSLVLNVGVLNPTNRELPFSIQNIRVKNGDRGMMWPVPAAELVAHAYAGILNQPQRSYMTGSARPPSYTANIFAQTTVRSGYMQTYGTAYITPQQNPYNSFVDMYNMGTAIRNSRIANANANAERDLASLNGMALKTTSVPALGTVEGAVYFWEVTPRLPYFVEVTFNGRKAMFEFDTYEFATH